MRVFKNWQRALAVTLVAGLAATAFPVNNLPVKADEADDEGYTLVFEDDFDGDSLNLEDWNVEAHEPKWVNAELQRYVSEDDMEGTIGVKDGILKIQPSATEKAGSGEVLKGNTFNGTDWSFGVNSDVGGNADITYNVDGSALVKVTNSGTENYAVQLQQSDLTLKKGHNYELTLKAKSSVARKMEISFLTPSWAWYAGTKFQLTAGSEPDSFSLPFTVTENDSNEIIFQINLGLIGGSEADSSPADVTFYEASLKDLSAEPGDSINDYDIVSGRINTMGKHDFTYGRFESRVRVPKGMGYLPAFWLMAGDEEIYGKWPSCGEIDIMEVMGQDTSLSYHTIHYGYGTENGHKESQGKKQLSEEEEDFYEAFHTFRLDWNPGKLEWYVDGVKVFEETKWHSGADESSRLTYPAPFDHDLYVILNLAVGGSWVGYPTMDEINDMSNQSFEVDYVKVWQKDEAVYKAMEEEVKRPEEKSEYREPDAEGNYVLNGDFATDIDDEETTDGNNWVLHLESDASGTQYAVEEGGIGIVPSAVGSLTHSIQLKQTGIPMYRGCEYTLTYEAKADSARTMVVDIEGPDNNWKRYMADTTVNLTDDWKPYSHTFTMEDKTDPNGSLEFNLGNQDSTVPAYIRNVKLTKKGEEIPEDTSKNVTIDGNYVHNGSFDQGDEEGKERLGEWDVSEGDEANVSVTNISPYKRELQVMVVVPEGASAANPVTVSQEELAPFGTGKYNFSFDAYTEDGAADGIRAVLAGRTFIPELTGTKTTFEYPVRFVKYLDREESYVSFEFTKPGVYYLDNVRVTEDALIKNGSFNAGAAYYQNGAYNPGSAKFSVAPEVDGHDHVLDVDIVSAGSADWNVQVKQGDVKVEKGKTYLLTFDAKATADRTVSVVMQRDGAVDGDWSVYSGDNNIELTDEWKTFSKEFTMEHETDPKTFFSVSLGYFEGVPEGEHHVYFDNIKLKEVKDAYEVLWLDEDGTELACDEVAVGITPEYTGETPKKAADKKYTYTFAGWDPKVVPVDDDAVYVAQYKATIKKFTVKYEMNGHGKAIKPDTVEYGKKVPRKADPTEKGYTFKGWYADKALKTKYDFNKPVTKNITIYAKWEKEKDDKPVVKTVSMYRLYNPNSGEHFYTRSEDEKDSLVRTGWNYEGIGWKAPQTSKIPVYRLYNENAGDHHYTISKQEKDNLVKAGWKYEGIGWYSDDAKSVPLYRQYNPNAKAGSHNYTVSKNERDTLLKAGWKDEGIAWYGCK